MLNYAGCCKCQSRAFLGEEGRVRSVTGGDVEVGEGDSGNEGCEEEEEETISFKRNVWIFFPTQSVVKIWDD